MHFLVLSKRPSDFWPRFKKWLWYKGEHDCTVLKRWLCLSTIQQLVIGVSCSSVSAKYHAITVLSHWLYSGTEDPWPLKVHLWLPLRPQILNWCLYGLLGLGSTSLKLSEMFAGNCGYDYNVSRLFLFLEKMVADFPSVTEERWWCCPFQCQVHRKVLESLSLEVFKRHLNLVMGDVV